MPATACCVEKAGRQHACSDISLTRLRAAGYDKPFYTVEEGVARYTAW